MSFGVGKVPREPREKSLLADSTAHRLQRELQRRHETRIERRVRRCLHPKEGLCVLHCIAMVADVFVFLMGKVCCIPQTLFLPLLFQYACILID